MATGIGGTQRFGSSAGGHVHPNTPTVHLSDTEPTDNVRRGDVWVQVEPDPSKSGTVESTFIRAVDFRDTYLDVVEDPLNAGAAAQTLADRALSCGSNTAVVPVRINVDDPSVGDASLETSTLLMAQQLYNACLDAGMRVIIKPIPDTDPVTYDPGASTSDFIDNWALAVIDAMTNFPSAWGFYGAFNFDAIETTGTQTDWSDALDDMKAAYPDKTLLYGTYHWINPDYTGKQGWTGFDHCDIIGVSGLRKLFAPNEAVWPSEYEVAKVLTSSTGSYGNQIMGVSGNRNKPVILSEVGCSNDPAALADDPLEPYNNDTIDDDQWWYSRYRLVFQYHSTLRKYDGSEPSITWDFGNPGEWTMPNPPVYMGITVTGIEHGMEGYDFLKVSAAAQSVTGDYL